MKYSEILRKLRADGWYVVSQSGSHLKMGHPTKRSSLASGYLIVPNHGSKEIGKGIANMLLKEAGLK